VPADAGAPDGGRGGRESGRRSDTGAGKMTGLFQEVRELCQ
jgi:hypothetical protein